jgi:V/A-type H+-transporting ATPase subunit E
MSYQELLEALRQEADEKIEKLWQEAREEAERAREEAAARLELTRTEYQSRQAAMIGEATRDILAEAERKVRETRLAALRELSERLSGLAASMLGQLRERRYAELFAALVGELPSFSWEVVRVNAADVETAVRHFPEARIVTDPAISGGLEVTGDNGRLCVVNTLEKRLERGWPQLLPEMIRVVNRELG